MKSSLKIYKILNKLSWPKTYSGKFLLISFIGIHIPLIGLIFYLLPAGQPFEQILPIILVVLACTLVGVFVTLWLLAKLLEPLTLTSRSLKEYIEQKTLPDLPTVYTDEAGSLMANTQKTILHLDELLTVKNDLLSIISHDARTPINAIMLAREMMVEELKEDPVQKDELLNYLSIIDVSAENQLAMLNNILSLTRLDSDEIIVEKEHVALKKLLQQIQKTNQLQIKAKNLNLEVNLGSFVDQMIYVDVIKLKAVINNLIQNAIKFTQESGTIKISASRSDGVFRLSVSDNGVGIEESKFGSLFVHNSSSHTKGTNKEKGTGLGLWICKVFTGLNDGTISVESEVGQGSTFTLTFDADQILSS